MFRLCIFAVCFLLAAASEYHYGLINFPSVLYVKPGDDFELPCKSDHGGAVRIFLPDESVPSHEDLIEHSKRLLEESQRTIFVMEIEEASQSGVYTCAVNHGPGIAEVYSLASCRVIVMDLCEEFECDLQLGETCTADYSTGAAVCGCQFECDRVFDPICSDTCELNWNECSMKELSCEDKIPREIMSKGFCPAIVAPTVRHLNTDGSMDIVVEVGEFVSLTAGLVVDGTPLATIEWKFFPADGGDAQEILNVRETYEFTTSASASGVYEAKIVHCKKAELAVINRYSVTVEEVEPTSYVDPEPDNIVFPTDDYPGGYPVCSVFPGGVVEAFNAGAASYNMACSHVLASDVFSGGDYSNPWFIYGTFDEIDGRKGALSAMIFYLGASAFEVQRGWIVNPGDGGEKLVLEEGVSQVIGESGCSVVFENLHLAVDCPAFMAYYDGIMAGHIKIKGPENTFAPLVKGRGNFGLCFDNNSGFRVNWQVGQTDGRCKIANDAPACTEVDATCGDYYKDPLGSTVAEWPWGVTGQGATVSCNELNCGDDSPTDSEKCALSQAHQVAAELKNKGEADIAMAGRSACSFDQCEWAEEVISRGCPQKNPPIPKLCV